MKSWNMEYEIGDRECGFSSVSTHIPYSIFHISTNRRFVL